MAENHNNVEEHIQFKQHFLVLKGSKLLPSKCVRMIACWIVCAIWSLLLSYERLLLVWNVVRFNWLILESFCTYYSLPSSSKSSVVMLNSYMFWILIVLRLVTDRCFLQFLRDNQNQESRFQHWLLEGETDRRRSERNGQPDTWRRCGWWETIRFLWTCHLEVCWYTQEAELKNTSKHQCWCDWRGTLPADFLRNIVDVSLLIPVLSNVQRRTMKGPVLMEVRAGIWFWVYLCEAKTNECRVCSWLYVVAWIVVVWTYHIVRKKKTVMCASSISM